MQNVDCTGSMPAEAHAGGGGPRREIQREQRNHERREVGQQVRRVRQDRQRVRHEAADHFDGHENQAENAGADQLEAGSARGLLLRVARRRRASRGRAARRFVHDGARRRRRAHRTRGTLRVAHAACRVVVRRSRVAIVAALEAAVAVQPPVSRLVELAVVTPEMKYHRHLLHYTI